MHHPISEIMGEDLLCDGNNVALKSPLSQKATFVGNEYLPFSFIPTLFFPLSVSHTLPSLSLFE